jgi:hypothetical protein
MRRRTHRFRVGVLVLLLLVMFGFWAGESGSTCEKCLGVMALVSMVPLELVKPRRQR